LSVLKYKKLDSRATTPTKANKSDAGYDLYSLEESFIRPGERFVVSTGIALEMPRENMVGLIWPRSGLSVKFGIDVLAGVIDSGYTGEIKVCLLNTSKDRAIFLEAGTKIAQIIFQEYLTFDFQEVESLSSTERGEKGFGSSDAKY
jgi:dUTP pyrophosphatase